MNEKFKAIIALFFIVGLVGWISNIDSPIGYLMAYSFLLLLMLALLGLAMFKEPSRWAYAGVAGVLGFYLFILLAYRLDLPQYQAKPLESGALTIVYPQSLRAQKELSVTLSIQQPYSVTLPSSLVLTSESPTVVQVSTAKNSAPLISTLTITQPTMNWYLYQIHPINLPGQQVTITLKYHNHEEKLFIGLETYRVHAFRDWVKTLAESPWTALVSVIASLSGLIFSWITTQIEQRKEERERKRLETTDRLKGLPENAQRFREYLSYQQNDPELAKEIWAAIKFEGWEKAALKQALEALGKGDNKEYQNWIALVETFAPTFSLLSKVQKLEAEITHRPQEAPSPSTQGSGNSSSSLSADEVLEIYTELGEPHSRVEAVIKNFLLITARSSDASLLNDLSQREEPEAHYLLSLIKDNLDESLRGRVDTYHYSWFPLSWMESREVNFDSQLTTLLTRNPFGPEKAELEPEPFECFIEPAEAWSELEAPRPSWIWGKPGCGHTAMALKFCQQHRSFSKPGSPQSKFVIYKPVTVPAGNEADWWQGVLKSFTQGLLEFFALNPYGFLAHPPKHQTLLAGLIRAQYPDSHTLKSELTRIQVRQKHASKSEKSVTLEHGAGLWLWQALDQATPLPSLTPQEARNWLPLLLPAGFSYLYFLLETDTALSPNLRAITDYWGKTWQAGGIYLKVLEKRETSPTGAGSVLPLQVDLAEMLKQRLRVSTNNKANSLDYFCERDLSGTDDALVRAAQGSPRGLVQLGNALFKAWKKSGAPKLTQEHFRAAGIFLR